MDRGRRGAARTASLGVLLLVTWGSGNAWAQADDEVSGLVVLPDSVPVAGALVELHRVTQDSGAIVDSTRTRPDGGFRFALDRDADPGAVYLIGARRGGIVYWGPALHGVRARPLDDAPITISVFDTTAVDGPQSDLRVGLRHVVLTPGSAGTQVDEIIDLLGRGERTLVSALDSVPIWRASLARDAHGVIPATAESSPQDLLLTGGYVGLLSALPPAGVRLGVSYFVPSQEYLLTLEHVTDRLELLVVGVPGLELEVEGVEEASMSGSDMGMSMRRFTATGLGPLAVVRVGLRIEQRGTRGAWLWVLAAVLLGAAAITSRRLVQGAG